MTDPWNLLAREKRLTPEIRRLILERYGERGRKALEIVDERRVKRYLDFFVVVGHSGEYVVEEEFCTCDALLRWRGPCSHVLAVRIAAITGEFEEFPFWYQDSWKADGEKP